MAKGEGEFVVRSNFVERVVKLPVVHIAWGYATNTYSHLKESNKLVNFTLTNAEKSITFAAEQARPVVRKFEKQIQAVDDLACKGLGTLEEKVPFITKPAEEIIGDTRKLYASTVYSRLEGIRKYGNDKVKSVTDFGLDKANAIFGNRLVQSVLTSVDGALVVTETYIDRILPPTVDEKKKDGKETKDVTPVARLLHLSHVLRIRAYRTISLKLEYAQERSIDILLAYPLQMIEISKGQVEHIVQYLSQLWDSFKQAGSDEVDSEKKNTALTALKNRALWAVGMLRTVPSLLPMYIYALVSWLDKKKTDEVEQHSEKQNGVAGNCANANHCNSYRPEAEQNCKRRITEENYES